MIVSSSSPPPHLQIAPGARVQFTVQQESIASHKVSFLVPQSHSSPDCTTPLPHSEPEGSIRGETKYHKLIRIRMQMSTLRQHISYKTG